MVEVTAPEGAVRTGERFTVTIVAGWEGEGTAIDVGRPVFEVPEGLSLEASLQESRTYLQDGRTRSTKKYALTFVAEKEGSASIGPFVLSAKQEGEELGLTGGAVDIEVVSRPVQIWMIGAMAVAAFIVIGTFILIKKHKAQRRQIRLST